METDDGKLLFGLGFDLSELKRGSKDIMSVLESITQEAVKQGESMDKVMDRGADEIEKAYRNASANIRDGFAALDEVAEANSKTIEQLKEQYARLGQEAGGAYSKVYGGAGNRTDQQQQITAEIKLAQSLRTRINEVSAALTESRERIDEQYQSVQKSTEAYENMRTKLRQMVQQLAEMEEAGLRGTEAYEKLREECGRLTNALGDAQKQAQILANDNAGLQGVISAVTGVTGAVSAAQGVMGLFASESQNLIKIQTKIQSLMSITMGLQQAANMLNKDSYARVVLLTKAQNLFSSATKEAYVALRNFGVSATAARTAAQALVGTLTLGVAAAISGVAVLIDKIVTKFKEAKKAADDFNKAVADAATEPVAALLKMSAEWDRLGNSLEEKQKYVEDHQSAFESLGLAIDGVTAAESLLSSPEQIEKFVKAQQTKAEAAVYFQQMEDMIKELIELQQKYEATPVDAKNYIVTSDGLEEGMQTQREIIQEQIDKVKEDIEKGFSLWRETEEKGNQELRELSGEAADEAAEDAGDDGKKLAEAYLEGSIGAVRQKISELNKALEGATTDEAREALQQQIADQQALLKKLNTTTADELAEREKAYRTAGETLASLISSNNKAEISLMEEGTDKTMAALKARYEGQLEEIENTRQKLIELNAQSGVETISNGEDAGLTTDQAGALGQAEEYVTKQYEQDQKAILDGILDDILTYEQKRQQVEEEYAAKRKALYEDDGVTLKAGVEQGNVDQLERQRKEALDEVDEYYAQQTDTFQTWCDSLSGKTYDSLVEIINRVRDELDEAEGSGMISGNELAALNAKLKKAEEALKKVKDAQKKADDEQEDGTEKNKRSIEEWNALRESLNDCASAFSELGDEIGGTAGDIISAVGSIGSKALSTISSIQQVVTTSTAAMATASATGVTAIKAVESASVVLTVISAVAQIATTIAGLFDNTQEKIDELDDRLEELQRMLDEPELYRYEQQYGDVYENIRDMIIEATDAQEHFFSTWGSGLDLINKYGFGETFWTYKGYFAASDALKDIEKTQKAVDALSQSILNVGYSSTKAVGSAKYDLKDTVDNYSTQILTLQAEIEEMQKSGKKKYEEDIEDAMEQIEDLYMEAAQAIADAFEDIVGGSADDIAQQLGDAFFDAFESGEDAAQAWADSVNDIIADMMKNMFIQNIIQPRVADWFNTYAKKLFGDDASTDLEELAETKDEMQDALNDIISQFQDDWSEYQSLFDDLYESSREGTTKGIATASQETVDELNGRATAIQGHTYNINANTQILVETTNLILQSVVNIEGNTVDIASELSAMRTSLSGVETGVSYVRASLEDVAVKGVKLKTS